MTDTFTWIGIALCLSQSAMFSGLNLAFFSVSRLQLEADSETGDQSASKMLKLRKDANFLLCTILWGNVSVNVLLALLSESVLAGVWAFAFSTAGITFFGEIVPQAYFSRHALRVAAVFSPVIRIYQVIFFPVAKPAALILDRWIGPEGPTFLREKDFAALIEKHIREHGTEMGREEGLGALNFLNLDDLKVSGEGRVVEAARLFSFRFRDGVPELPAEPEAREGIHKAFEKLDARWAIITDRKDRPILVLDTERFLRDRALGGEASALMSYCHEPVVIDDPDVRLGRLLHKLVVEAEDHEDRVVDRDCILYWPEQGERRIITGKDLLGRLLQGIVRRDGIRG